MLGGQPADYWRLGDTGTTSRRHQLNCGADRPATYNNVTQGVSGGPFADQPVTASTAPPPTWRCRDRLVAPAADSVSLWFKTTGTDEVLFSEETGPVTGDTPTALRPVLYVGEDGKLNGEFWTATYTDADVVGGGQRRQLAQRRARRRDQLASRCTSTGRSRHRLRERRRQSRAGTNVSSAPGSSAGTGPTSRPPTSSTGRVLHRRHRRRRWYPRS